MIGQTVSHYKITRELGAGGMGVVYEAVDTKLDRTVALKFLPPESTRDSDAKARFVQEAKAASRLDHNNVCVIHEIDESEQGQLFLVMARYEGETLKDRLKRGPLSVDETVDLTEQMLSGLAAAHAKNLVHRDMKPANIFITEEGVVKILDFGLAQLVGEARLTREGTTLGTVHYMAPEQVQGEMVDPRTDLWSVGVLIHEMITGNSPFQGAHEQAVIYSILNTDARPLDSGGSGAPEWLARLVSTCLSKNLEARPTDAMTLIRALGEQGRSPQAPGFLSRWRSRSRFRGRGVLMVTAALVLLIILGREFLFGPNQESIWLIVSSLENQTEDPGLGPMLEEGLLIGLGQSSRVRLFTGQRLDLALGRMGRTMEDTLDVEIACELALREEVPAVLASSIGESPDGFKMVARIIDPETRETRYTEIVEVDDEDRLMGGMDKVVKAARKYLGESSWSISRSSEPLARVSTPSLEALRFYSMGIREADKERAISLLGQAVAADSNFAMAHARLARAYYYSAATADALDHSRRAFELRDRLPLREKMYVEGEFHRIRAQFGEAVKCMQALLEIDPDDSECRSNLVHAYLFLIQYRKALDQFLQHDEEIRNQPHGHHTHGILLGGLGRYQEAEAQLRQAIAKAGGPALTSRLVLSTTLICDMQVDAARAQLDSMLALDTDSVIGARYMVGRTLAALGRYEDSLLHLQQARDMALAFDDSNRAAWTDILSGRYLAARGDHAAAARVLGRAVEFWPGDVPHYLLGRELAVLGDTAAARAVERDLTQMVDLEPTGRNRVNLNKLRGSLAYVQGDFEGAIEYLESCPLELDARLLLGQAYVAVGKEEAGRTQFRFIIDNRFHAFMDGLVDVWPLAYYNLGVLEYETGDHRAARDWLTTFTGYWVEGDEDIAELVDAKRRLGLLSGTGQ